MTLKNSAAGLPHGGVRAAMTTRRFGIMGVAPLWILWVGALHFAGFH
jgi:hypothetical protein